MDFIEKISDPYERKAGLTPALLVLLPILVPMIGHYGAENPILTGIFGLICGSGALFALSSVVRGTGRKLEGKLIKKWGGLPTTISLRHANNVYDKVTKARYHEEIEKKLGIKLPSHDKEAENPQAADECYIAACRLLRGKTRQEKGLLLKENIAYGFHRNMLAINVPGILISLIAILHGLTSSSVLQLAPFSVDVANIFNIELVPLLTLLISFFLLMSWIFYFSSESVKQIGFCYAERLFECLDRLG